ncbi:MAG: flagellar hook-associated protein FlgL [Actinomycetota bacterium]|nr:flagellar hook-associated protein FlgL [Actinomycetota bacterium]
MAHRISNLMLSRSVVADANAAAMRLAETRRELSSGKRIERPSDDPLGANRALGLRTDLDGVRQHRRNIAEATGWLNAADSALARITDMAHRVHELTVQGATDSATPTARAAIALELDHLAEGMKQEASTQYAGRYVFSGAQTLTKPYAAGGAGADAYLGDGAGIAREIGPGVSVQVNTTGSRVLGSGQVAADGKLLNVVRDIADRLRSGTAADINALRTTDLARLAAATDALVSERAAVGGTTNRLEAANARLVELEESATKLLSETEDTDMAEAMVRFSMQQSVYQSALRSGAVIVQASLMDFLR